MAKEITLETVVELITKNNENVIGLINKTRGDIDIKFEGLTELMIKNFDRVYNRLDVMDGRLERVEFNTNGLEKRVSTLEDKFKIVANKLGLQN